MNQIQQIVAYFCIHYPYATELSNARMTKLVYLADWFSALADNTTLTEINWVFNHYGPYVDDVINNVSLNPHFSIIRTQTNFGSPKSVVSYFGQDITEHLPVRTRQILDLVINKTQDLYFNDFINYVYSTYPVRAQDRYANLNLVALAQEYRNLPMNNN
ncbi:Panacea domain-containing protein [Vibrio alfacsensis]|uniref:Panacea domain-containing protein n=1 Tax=Vibrio alfacsensis TaxID=1074311 RepID=UPI002ADD784B|nr:Panacea domain-containing protein [Vibrio alfacsensis]WQE78010.1 Panacea domain-containing protein [Vibrio alfacsensis]